MSSDLDLALDQSILETLVEIKALLTEISAKNENVASSAETLTGAAVDLSEKLASITTALEQTKEYTVEVTVEGADGAINDLVSRVVEEVIIRVKQENYQTITEN